MTLIHLPIVILLIMAPLAFGARNEEPVMKYGKPEVTARTKRLANEFKADVEKQKLRKKTNQSLDAIIKLAAYKLKRVGKKAEASKLLKEWEEQYSLYLEQRDLGDHTPLSTWLAEQYQIWVFWLSKDVVHVLRLDDVNIINFAIPVVFSCVDNVDQDEYRKHFVPLMKTTSFWVSFWTCVGMSWGTGFLYCSPIAMGVEYLVEISVAPYLNETSWKLFCNKETWGIKNWR